MTYQTTAADIALRDQSITQRIFENLETRPDAIVLTDGMNGAAMTAADFMTQVKQLAGGLTARGMGAGKTVALMSPNIPHYCVVFHAVAWAGGTITTINPTYTASEVAHQLRDSAADLLITLPLFRAGYRHWRSRRCRTSFRFLRCPYGRTVTGRSG